MSDATTPPLDDHSERRARRLNNLLAAMIAIYGILTAATAYSASVAGGHSDENYVRGLAHLTDANFFYTEGSRTISYDVWLFDQIVINSEFGASDDLMQYFVDSYSQPALDSIERSDTPFDEGYQEDVYSDGNRYQELADASFELAELWGERDDIYQLYVTMMAVGLSFAAWASLMDGLSRTKWVFTIMAVIILVVGLFGVVTTGLLSEPLPNVIEIE